MKLEPAQHPLAEAIHQLKDKIGFSRIQPHPFLPFGILTGGNDGVTVLSWAKDKDNSPFRLFRKRISAHQFSFSPDGKWLVFTNENYDRDTKKTYLMPVSEKYAHFLGTPILLSDKHFDDKNFAWTTNPTSFVASYSEKIYRWELTNTAHPESNMATFHDYLVERDLEQMTLKAAEGTSVDKIKRLIASDADLNAKDQSDYGYTALMKAADDGDADVVKLLIAANANLHVTNTYGATAFTVAARAGHLEIVKLLLSPRSHLNAALMDAVEGGHAELVRFLIDTKADVNAKHFYGKTPLFDAAGKGRIDIVKLLIDAGANVNAKNDGGYSILAEVVKSGHADIVKFLTNAGAK